ncbi:MAG: NADPH-dependent F420 reductase [Chloroflexi bacterium]|nr:NADPH-dependent F420 reductase [Chloroflexota bacterium]
MLSEERSGMLGFIGGTGPEGRGLALRWAMAGEEIIIGSRSLERAQEAARDVEGRYPTGRVRGLENVEAVARSEMIVISVPYEGHKAMVEALRDHLKGKIVIDVVAPLVFERGRARAVPVNEGSAAQQAQLLVPEARVVGAFQNISAPDLLEPNKSVDCDVVVCSDDQEAKKTVMKLAERIRGVRAVDGNGLACAKYVEELTALLLNINRVYKAHSSIKIVGI